ncbi:MAG: GNAT family N-acetyltransferase [Gemmatimonadaceae bacterium]|nr:GNAT family N-acetyltransferase [Gemmatimonadaceae bacterium]
MAKVIGEYALTADPSTDRVWIAERAGENVGSVFLVRHPDREGVCKLRLLLVDPKARGTGLGRKLVRECLSFAREAGYRRMTLWTNANLDAAKHIYDVEGFTLVAEEPHTMFGPELVGQTWERDL